MRRNYFVVKDLFILQCIVFCICAEEINPNLKPLLDKLDLDEKYHGYANEMYNEADKTLTKDKDPLKHIEYLNFSVRMLLNSISSPDKLLGTDAETMGKKVLQFAREEFGKNDVAEGVLRSRFNMTDDNIKKFKTLFDDTKTCIDKLNAMFDCV